LGSLTPVDDPHVLIGAAASDDVGVYLLDENRALVLTTDFFTPIVDDPYAYGAIAVANALSDLYAKGVDPLVGLNLVAFPSKKLPLTILTEILRGGLDKASEAGVVVLGGHTIDDPEPKYGLAVVGLAKPEEIILNSTARPGDVLVLTKPLGIGVITTAIKRQKATPETERRVIEIMTTLNRAASRLMREVGVHAATDVTGYGLLGHLWIMLTASGVGATIWLSSVPVLEEAWELAQEGIVPGGTLSNHAFVDKHVLWDPAIAEAAQLILCDAQTSGGLLISLAREKAATLVEKLQRAQTPAAAIIGEVIEDQESRIRIRP